MMIPAIMFLKFYVQVDVKLSARQIIRHGILDIIDVRDPVIGADIGNIKQVEAVEPNPDALEMAQKAAARFPFLEFGEQCVAQADVDALIGGSAEVALIAGGARRSNGKPVRKDAAKREFQLRKFGEIIREVESDGVALIRWSRNFHSVKILLSLHQ